MPVFLDTTKRRKLYFRATLGIFFVFILLAIGLASWGIAHWASTRTPIAYEDAAQRYHYYYSAANDKKVALTIDDGPHPPTAHNIMDALSAAKVPATFFYIGEKAFVRPDLVQEAAQRGFDIGIHSFDHGPGVHSSPLRIGFELNSTAFIIGKITGKAPEFYRPPFLLGIGVDPTINPYIPPDKAMIWTLGSGYLPVGSDIDPKDWLVQKPEDIVPHLTQALKDTPKGHIILLHEDVNTQKALPEVIAYLRTNGYNIVPLSELITPPTEIALTHNLSLGDTDVTTGGEVSKLQWFLYTEHYLDPYTLTGKFDEETQLALVGYQQASGLITASNYSKLGIADAKTRAFIHEKTLLPKSVVFAPTLYTKARTALVNTMVSVYTAFFPFVSKFFVAVVFITLLLVVLRVLGMVGLLLVRAYRGPLYGESTTTPTQGISVLIPAFNEQENIAATVRSVMHSAYTPFEIIVIDDGSTDNTALQAKSVIDAYPSEQATLIQLENGGKARALNVALEAARYEIVMILDADAVLDPLALYHFAKHFADPRVGAVAGKVSTTHRGGFLDLFQRLEYAVGQNIDKQALGTIGAVGVVPGPAGAWRKETLQQVGGFHTDTLVEDQEMTLCILRAGKKVIYEAQAISYTETPENLENFLKQRFRWVYGTMQCFWKHKGVFVAQPTSSLSVVVMPNILIYNVLLPLTYPLADSALLIGLLFGQAETLLLPFLIFTFLDMLYAFWGVYKEEGKVSLILAMPLQRLAYKWLIYYTVMRAFVRAIEGSGASWNKFRKVGETRRFYNTNMGEFVPASVASPYQVLSEEVTTSFQGPEGTAVSSTNLQDVVALSSMPRHFHMAGDTSSPARSPNVLTGVDALPNTYAKSSSPLGPTSSH